MSYLAVNAAQLFSAEAPQLKMRVYPGGAMVVTSKISTEQATEYRFDNDPNGIHISAQYFLAGEASIRFGNGAAEYWSENGMSVIRADTPGFRLRVEAGQTLRHICVAMYHHDLQATLDRFDAPQIRQLMATDAPVDMAVPVPSAPGMRQAAERLYNLSHEPGLAGLKAEGLAIEFLADVLERFSVQETGTEIAGQAMPWQREAVSRIRGAIDADPLHDHSPSELLGRFGMGEAMARRVFRDEVGTTLTAYMRQARLEWARRALNEGDTVKRIAFACGYTHIGNFTRAYRQAFGEAPRDTRLRSRGG